jgi:heme/copper-type cytochrome/quinol oxidase subunit 3
MWLFFISEAFLFGALLATRFYLWGDTRPELDQMVGLIVTSVLLLSSASRCTSPTRRRSTANGGSSRWRPG